MRDLLTPSTDYGMSDVPDISTTETTNRLLAQLIRETQKAHPSQRCVLQLQFSNAAKILDGGSDVCEVKFLASGKPVLAQYLTICNNTNETLSVGLNEPVSLNSAGTFAGGIQIAANTSFQLPVEIEKIQLRLVTSAASGKGIAVGNAPAGVPANGIIKVYGWTIPNSDKDQTE